MSGIPVFQASLKIQTGAWTGTDYAYPVGAAAARAAIASFGYSIDGVAFVAQDAAGSGLAEFQCWTQNAFHFYTTNTSGENLTGWTYSPPSVKAYLTQISQTQPQGAVPLQRWVGTSRTCTAHFYCADANVTKVPDGFVQEDPTFAHTGWVYAPTRLELSVTYDCSGNSSGIRVTGGNAVGQQVTLADGSTYTMKADDALVAYGIGNWIRFNKADGNNWHIAGIDISPVNGSPSNSGVFETIASSDDTRLAVVDMDEDNSQSDYAYKYTLQVYDVARDKIVSYDPKIINRAPAVTT